MTPDEVAVVASAVARLDSGCLPCVAEVACRLDRDMPWVGWMEAVADANAYEWTVEDLLEHAPCKTAT